MVNIIIIAHSEIASSFVSCVEHVFAKKVQNLHTIAVKKTQQIDQILKQINNLIQGFGSNKEVLLLTDLFGATPSNIATHLVKHGEIELITGLNMPMLIRAITYADKGLRICIDKALDGAKSGIVYLNGDKA